jgi:large subunit ribosomal protein L9
MKVILQRDIPKVGRDGEIVNVADGYARNYLFPRQFAVPATGGALKEHAARIAREKEREAKQVHLAQASADNIKERTVTIVGKAGAGTKLYGSITAQDVAAAIAEQLKVTVDKRRVGMTDPIKNLGTFTVPVRLHSDISVSVVVEVVTEEDLQRRRAAAEAAEAAAKAAAEAPAAEASAPAAEASAPAAEASAPAEAAAPSETVAAEESPAADAPVSETSASAV